MDVVLLACDGEPWLADTLEAIAVQSRPVDATWTYDAASRDASADVLSAYADATGSRAHAVARRAGLFDVARATSALLDAERSGSEPAAPADHWYWLLHDDSAPEPDALAQLLAAVEVAPSVGIAGCKVRDWDDPRLLHQAGFATSALGRPLTGIEPGDRDQGQRDACDDVLAVSTAGMLVRRGLLDALGGDPVLAVLGDDLDLCRRARLAGARVIVVPSAVVRHADATRTGRRDTPAAHALRWAQRRAAVHSRLVGAAPLALPLVLLAVLAGGLARALGRVAAKQPDRAVGEVTAVLAALAAPRRIWAARRAAAATAVRPRRVLRPLYIARRDVVRWHRDRASRVRWGAAVPAQDEAASAGATSARARGGRPLAAAIVVALAAVDVAALHRLLARGDAVGGALLPAPAWTALWSAARSTWQSAGLGTAAPADPWLSLLALLALPVGASPTLAVRVLLLAALPMSALTAWAAAGAATRSRWRRAVAALGWAAALPLLEAVDQGLLGALVAHVALPLVALGLARLAQARSRRHALPAAAGAGIAAAVAVAGAPALLLPVLVLLAVVALTVRRWTSCLLWTALAPIVTVASLLVPALSDARVLASSPGLPIAVAPSPVWVQLLGLPAGAGAGAGGSAAASPLSAVRRAAGSGVWAPSTALDLAGLVAGSLLVVVAAVVVIASLLSADQRAGRGVRLGAWTAGVGLLAAAVLSGQGRATSAGGAAAWTGPAVSLVLLGLGVAAIGGPAPGDRGAALGSAPRRSGRRAVVAVVGVLAVLAPVAELGAWTTGQLRSPGAVVAQRSAEAAVAADGARSPDAVRTLELTLTHPSGRRSDVVTASLRRGGATLTDPSAVRDAGAVAAATSPDPAGQAVLSAAAVIAAGERDPRSQLADLGVGFVLLDGSRGEGLDAVPGLARAGRTSAGTLYRVLPTSAAARPARARLVDPSGATLAVLPSRHVDVGGRIAAAPAGTARTLVLAERSDPGWRAWLDGQELPRTVHDGWSVAFDVPASGGRLSVSRSDPMSGMWTALQIVVLGLTLLLAVPVPGARRLALLAGAPR